MRGAKNFAGMSDPALNPGFRRGWAEAPHGKNPSVIGSAVADLVSDLDLLLQARDDAAEILQGDEGLARPQHASLRRVLVSRYKDTFDLIDVA